MSDYFCNPNWHHGNKDIPADFLVTAPEPSEGEIKPPLSYAACYEHISRATDLMLEAYRAIMIRRVNDDRV